MKILIAEDCLLSRNMLESIIKNWGYNVETVCNGVEALEHINSEDPPKIVLLDWIMPELSGIDVCKIIRNIKTRDYFYIIMLTSMAHEKNIIEGMDAGADDYVTKPFVPAELEVRIKAGVRIISLQEELLLSMQQLEDLSHQVNNLKLVV